MTSSQPMYFLVLSGRNAFFRLKDVLPECFLYRESSPGIDPLICLDSNVCHVGKNCMETLVRRLSKLFEGFKNFELVVLYFKSNSGSLKMGIFFSNLKDFEVRTMNPYGWKRIQSRAKAYQFVPTFDFFSQNNEPINQENIDP